MRVLMASGLCYWGYVGVVAIVLCGGGSRVDGLRVIHPKRHEEHEHYVPTPSADAKASPAPSLLQETHLLQDYQYHIRHYFINVPLVFLRSMPSIRFHSIEFHFI